MEGYSEFIFIITHHGCKCKKVVYSLLTTCSWWQLISMENKGETHLDFEDIWAVMDGTITKSAPNVDQ